ncbi:MAG: hypothetical protein HY321_11195 [Armatimonadetes bacterium]|nr:hypothetical protein [Armatimonadota bacterium]
MSDPQIQRGETPATREVIRHLEALGIPFERLEHPPVATSQAAADARGSRLAEGAKALTIKAGDSYHHLIISAAQRVDNQKLRRILGTRRIRFATAAELRDLTGCLPGAVPPFGNLFGLPVLMDDALLAEETVFFNCASHTISLRMRRADMVTATEARVVDFHLEE